jgi:hypothetical protein
MGDVTASAAGSVAAGHDIINSLIITGDHAVVFRGEYEAIGQSYINHASVFARLDLDHFTGHEATIASIDSFLREPRGYIIVEGESGVGKSALLGWLARTRGYIHHFTELTPGPAGLAPALKSLASQLVLAYGMSPHGVLPATAAQPYFFASLLAEAAGRARGAPLVIVIDGVDQAAIPDGQNVLGLPASLPNGVFVIVSQQPAIVPLNAPEVPRLVLRLAAGSQQNLLDLRRYLEAAYDRLPVAHSVPRDSFVAKILAKCNGRWQHLVLIIREIESGTRKPQELDTVPNGLMQQYCALCRRTRDAASPSDWSLFRAVLATIAAAEEPVSLETLNAWLPTPATAQSLAPLLTARPAMIVSGRSRYRPEHTTVRDFFHGRANRSALTASELEVLDDAATATAAALDRITAYYLQRFDAPAGDTGPRFHSNPPDVSEPEQYGLTHILNHLEQIGRHEDALALLWRTRAESRTERVPAAKWLPIPRTKTVTVRHHLWTDLKARWGNWAEVAQDVDTLWRREADLGGPQSLTRQLRLSLLKSSLMSRISEVKPVLVIELVRLKLWTADQTLAFAAAYLRGDDSDVTWRPHETLGELAVALADRGDSDAALAAVYMIATGSHQAEALGCIAPRLPASFHSELLKRVCLYLTLPPHIISGLRPETDEDLTDFGLAHLRGQAVAAIATALPPHFAAQAYELAAQLPPLARIFASTPLIPQLALARRTKSAEEIFAVAQGISSEPSRSFALARTAPYLPPDERGAIVDALVADLESHPPKDDSDVLLEVALPAYLQVLTSARLLEILSRNYGLRRRLPMLLKADAHPDPVFLDAAVDGILGNDRRWELVRAVLPHLSGEHWQKVMDFARDRKEAWLAIDLLSRRHGGSQPLAGEPVAIEKWIVKALRNDAIHKFPGYFIEILPKLAALGKTQLALSLAAAMRPSAERGRTLAALVPFAPAETRDALLDEALVLAGAISDSGYRVLLRASCLIEAGRARDALNLVLAEPKLVVTLPWSLAELAEHAAARDPGVALEAALSIPDYQVRLENVSTVAHSVPLPLLEQKLPEFAAKQSERPADYHVFRCIIAARSAETLSPHLEALLSIPDPDQRDAALICVIPHLPPSHLPRVSEVALESYLSGKHRSNIGPKLFDSIFQQLNPAQLRRLIEAVWPPKKFNDRLDVAAEAAMRLVELEHSPALGSLAATLGASRTQQQLVAAIANLTPDPVLRDVFATAESWANNWRWAPPLARVARGFALRGDGTTAIAILDAIDVRSQIGARLALAGALSAADFAKFWVDTFLRVCSDRQGWVHSSRLEAIVTVMFQLPSEVTGPALSEGLRILSLRSREAHVIELCALVPLIHTVGGPGALESLTEAAETVGAWFP